MRTAPADPAGSKTQREVRAGLRGQGPVPGGFPALSESVFKRHAQQLREDRVVVYGFGECKTLEAFSNACSRFIDLENIIETESTE